MKHDHRLHMILFREKLLNITKPFLSEEEYSKQWRELFMELGDLVTEPSL